MKTEEEIRAAYNQCTEYRQAEEGDEKVYCPLWPDDDYPGCCDCTARHAWRFVLDEPVDL